MSVRVIYKSAPFSDVTKHIDLEQGKNLQEIVRHLGLDEFEVCGFRGDRVGVLDAVMWRTYTPVDNEIIVMNTLPQGGGGDDKNPLLVIGQILIAAAIPAYGAGLGEALGLTGKLASAVGGAIIGFAGSVILNSLVKPPTVAPVTSQTDDVVKSFSISASRNKINPSGAIPYLVGRKRIFPPYAAQPFTLSRGNDQYLHSTFVVSGVNTFDEVAIEQIKIGDVDISTYNEVEITTKPYTLMSDSEKAHFSPNIQQSDVGTELSYVAGYVTLSTEPDCVGFIVDLVFPRGLTYYNRSGGNSAISVDLIAEYKKSDATEWLPLENSLIAELSVVSPYDSSDYIRNSSHLGDNFCFTSSGNFYKFDDNTGAWEELTPPVFPSGAGTWYGDIVAVRKQIGYAWGDMPDGLYVYLYHQDVSDSIFVYNASSDTWARQYYYSGSIPYRKKGNFVSSNRGITNSTSNCFLALYGGYDATENLRTDASFGALVGDEVSKYNVGLIPMAKPACVGMSQEIFNNYYTSVESTKPFEGRLSNISDLDYCVASTESSSGTRGFLARPVMQFTYNAQTVISLRFDLIRAYQGSGVIRMRGTKKPDEQTLTIFTNNNLGNWSLLDYRDGTDYYKYIDFSSLGSLSSPYQFDMFYNKSGEYALFNGAVAITSTPPEATVTGSNFTITENSLAAVRYTLRKNDLLQGRYDIRIKRVTADSSDSFRIDSVYVDNIKSFFAEPIITGDVPVQTVSVIIRANEQLNGALDEFNLVASRSIPVYDDATETWSTQETANPAWYYIDALCGAYAKQPLDRDVDFYLPEIVDFADTNETEGRKVNYYHEEYTMEKDFIDNLLAVGRASWGMTDGKYSVVTDEIKSLAKGFYSPRSMTKDSFKRVRRFYKVPHGIKIRFQDEDNEWQDSVCIVYDDGYDVNNASEFEEMTFIGVTSYDLAWKLGRYHIAQMRLRPYSDFFTITPEFLDIKRGDKVHYQHDSVLVGTGDARINRLQTNLAETEVIALELDDAILSETGKTYRAEIVKWDGTTIERTFTVGTTGWNNTITLVSSILVSEGLERGMRVLAWDDTVGICEGVVVGISPRADLTADIEVQAYNTAIQNADQGTIPPYVNYVTTAPDIKRGKPNAPEIYSIRTDDSCMQRSVDGSLEPVAMITLKPYSGNAFVPASVQARARLTSNEKAAWIQGKIEEASGNFCTISGLQIGEYHDISVRYVTKAGIASDWTTQTNVLMEGNVIPPDKIGNISLTLPKKDRNLIFSWPKSEILDLGGYEIRRTPLSNFDWDSGTKVWSGKGTSASFVASEGVKNYLFKVFDTANNYSDQARRYNLSIYSPSINKIDGRAAGNVAILTWVVLPVESYYAMGDSIWQGSNLPIAKYEIFKGATFAGAVKIGESTSEFIAINEIVGGTYTYWVQATDVGGNVSSPASVSVTVANNPAVKYLTTFTNDMKSPDTSTNWLYNTETSLAPFDTTQTLSDKFGVDNAWTTFQDQVDSGYIRYAQPTPTSASYEIGFDYGEVLASAVLTATYSYTPYGDVLVSPTIYYRETTGDSWTSGGAGLANVTATNFRYAKVVIEASTTDGTGFATFNNLSLDISAERFEETDYAISSSSGSVRVDYTASFATAEAPLLTYQGSGAYFAVADSYDDSGFYLSVYDISGNRVNGTVLYSVKGIL